MMFCCDGAHDATSRRSSKAAALQLPRAHINPPALILEPPHADEACEAPIAAHLRRVHTRHTRRHFRGRRRQATEREACLGRVT
jgi:hypothetical protein